MQIVSSIAAMQRLARKWQRAGIKVGFVPTMGYLHAGHLSLVKRARQAVGKSGKVVVSIYVNPTQFAPTEDLSKYPRDLKRDLKLLYELKVDVVFTPSDAEMYPVLDCGDMSPLSKRRHVGALQSFSTYVVEEKLSRTMEGASRPTHFRGVTTVVAKLFNIVLPDVAVFGQKDFQQAAIIKRMVSDLNFPVKIIVAPTLREPDGLAMSSRNKYLNG
ncbi:MAG TPA: pantoate--beta-alanine ligase, partial [Dongiaceae bacterium]|nr:pantoate--beta-alanine ligase [Dongiaceae bacterium]